MNLNGKIVNHKTLGVGTINDFIDGVAVISFENGKVSKFRFPNVFSQGFLDTPDMELNNYVQNLLANTKCDLCAGENLKIDEIDGVRICKTCRDIHTSSCPLCKETHLKSLMQFVSDFDPPYNEIKICSSCAIHKSFLCSKCGHRYFNEYRATIEGGAAEYTLCNGCIEISKVNDMVYKRFNAKKHLTFVMDQGDILYVAFFDNECMKHNLIPALIRLKLSNGEEIVVEGQYCTDCRQVQITRNTCAEYSRYHKIMKSERFLKGIDDVDEESFVEDETYRERVDESKLRRLGYSVAEGTFRSDFERQALLKKIISTNQISKGAVINHLKNLIRINGKKLTNSIALKKWKSDLDFVLKL